MKRTLVYTVTITTDVPREKVEHELELTVNELVDNDEDRTIEYVNKRKEKGE